MINHKKKLELTWIGKENRPKLEPRILIEDPMKSNHAPFRVSDQDLFDNRLIFGDNLLAIKVLEQEFAGKTQGKGFLPDGKTETCPHIAGVSKTMPKKDES